MEKNFSSLLKKYIGLEKCIDNFIFLQVVLDYYNGIMEKSGETGQMDAETFKSIFRLAFPERPEEKLDALIVKLRNVEKTSGTIRK